MKVVINRCFGGFGLSHEAMVRYAELKGLEMKATKKESDLLPYEYHVGEEYFSDHEIPRDDPCLVQVVEEMGQAASGWAAELAIVEIPDDVNWYISEYDGNEHVAERHRTWG